MNLLLINLHKYLILFIPVALLTGPSIPDLFTSLSGLLMIYIIINKKLYNYFINTLVIALFFFYFFILFRSLISVDIKLSLSSSLFYFRFIILAISINYLYISDKYFLDKLYYIFTFVFLFLIIDSLIQYFYGSNIFGFNARSDDRVSSVFNQQAILGSYIVRFLPVYVAIFFITRNKLNIFFNFNLLLLPIIILISGERVAVMLFILFILAVYFISKINFKNKIYYLLVLILSLLALFFIFPKMYERLIYKTYEEISNFNYYTSDNLKLKINNNLVPSIRMSLYKNSLLMFMDNKIIGVGPKLFRVECKKYEEKILIINKDNVIEKHFVGCSTHPHNIYFQLLAETGIVGTLFVIFLFFYIIYKIISLFINNRNYISKIYNFRVFIMFAVLLNIFPLIPTGSFFNNWMSIIYFYPLGFLINNKNL